MEDPSNFLRQSYITKREMHEVVMQTAEPDSTREATERIMKILDSTYAKADLENIVANNNHLNAEKRTLLLIRIEDFKYLFDGTLGDWATEPVDL